jgi:hypothetical protein
MAGVLADDRAKCGELIKQGYAAPLKIVKAAAKRRSGCD